MSDRSLLCGHARAECLRSNLRSIAPKPGERAAATHARAGRGPSRDQSGKERHEQARGRARARGPPVAERRRVSERASGTCGGGSRHGRVRLPSLYVTLYGGRLPSARSVVCLSASGGHASQDHPLSLGNPSRGGVAPSASLSWQQGISTRLPG